MATFDITTHGLLSEKAQQLQTDNPEAFDANVIGAEYILDVSGAVYEGDALQLVRYALVYQVNYQLENDQEAEIYDRVSEGDRTYEYKQEVGISPMAQQFIDKLKAKEEGDARTLAEQERRGRSTTKRNVVLW